MRFIPHSCLLMTAKFYWNRSRCDRVTVKYRLHRFTTAKVQFLLLLYKLLCTHN